MGYEIMEEVLDSQTAKTESEPFIVENELTLVSERTLQKYKKNTLLEVVEVLENGNVIVQNEGDETDRWEITKEVFNSTYDEYVEEVKQVHICKNKCDSCEFDYAERSCV